MFNEFDNEQFKDAEIVNEQTNETPKEQTEQQNDSLYLWHKDDYENKTVYGTARPLYKEKQVETKKKSSLFRYTAAVIAGMLAGALIFAGATMSVSFSKGSSSPNQVAQSPTPSNSNGKNVGLFDDELSIVDIAKKAGPAVVGIVCKTQTTTFFGTTQEGQGSGSGIIIKSDGYIITNHHVIDGATEVSVVLNNGTSGKSYDAKVIGKDMKTDLAVLKIDENDLPVAEIGQSSALEVGERAVAIGNPGGQEFAGSVTAGVISALNRTMNVEGRNYTLIQTDAAINPGNSGGALVNKYGQVVGINTVKIGASGYEGMGFAIPIDIAMPIINELLQDGYVKGRPVIGVSLREITSQMSKRYNLPEGLYVLEVSEFSGAEKAGIKISDIITKADGEEVKTVDALNKIRDKHKAKESIELTIIREEKVMNVTVVLGEETPDQG